MNYALHLLIYFAIYSILAVSLNLVVGYCGLLTLAHAGYYAAGAYTYGLLTLEYGWPVIPALAAAFAVPAVLSLAVSLPAWRLRGDFFVMVTLAAQAILYSAIYNWHSPDASVGSWANLTNGPFGIAGISRPGILGVTCDTIGAFSVFACVVAAAVLIVCFLLVRSPWGRVLKAMRDDELATRALGKNVRLLKVQAFFLSCGMAGIAGALYSSYVSYIDPSLASLDESILMVSMVIVGGLGNFRGPLVGAALLLAIPEGLRLIQISDVAAAEMRMMAYGLLLVVLMHVRPQGIAGTYRIE